MTYSTVHPAGSGKHFNTINHIVYIGHKAAGMGIRAGRRRFCDDILSHKPSDLRNFNYEVVDSRLDRYDGSI
jgi:hypothetical protein